EVPTDFHIRLVMECLPHIYPKNLKNEIPVSKSRQGFYLSAISEAIVSRRIRKSLMDALRSHFG
ncbi:hypothetical protein, partial [Limosilactobacillus fermentum]|uniref:hypothetical protein n=1 Tax=Limosilactobacillus fermentum TaxID=1613 RepID=UPI001C9E60C9